MLDSFCPLWAVRLEGRAQGSGLPAEADDYAPPLPVLVSRVRPDLGRLTAGGAQLDSHSDAMAGIQALSRPLAGGAGPSRPKSPSLETRADITNASSF
jgi:hypothetical protein